MRLFFSLLFSILMLGFSQVATAQMIEDPTTWKYEVVKKGENTYELIFRLKLKDKWHIWSQNPGGDGFQIPPTFTFDKNSNITRVGKTVEKGKSWTGMMDGVDNEVTYLEGDITYKQTIKVTENTTITGEHEYQVCDDKMCLPPKRKKFSFKITDATNLASEEKKNEDSLRAALVADSMALIAANSIPDSTLNINDTAVAPLVSDASGNTDKPKAGRSLLWLFLASLGSGFLALLTPCVYSMVPITVSFFTKRSKSRSEGIKNAVLYALSIIIIFTLLGVLISLLFGGQALNALSTNWIANMFFFLIFMVFGISFLGAFEITLPSSWTSATDSKAGVGSFGGIFFMALTLAIVSFSCTGPIVGPLLVMAGQGGVIGPTIGMFGFSIGLALPFALFAIFPGLINKMATSGGWMNQVKVVLGFVEIALALKFLSNADLQQGWRLLDREIFIAIWIILAVLLGFYLLGKLKMSKDDASPKNIYGQEYVSIFKLFLAISTFSFAVYLLPGMWGAPLNGMSAFVPPMGTQDYVLYSGGSSNNQAEHAASPYAPKKYVEEMKPYEPQAVINMGLETYYDYDEAMLAAKALKKPIMLDFTGVNCINCRKMEGQVWSKPEVLNRMKNDFIVASLYCDISRIKLPESEQFISKALGDIKVETLGELNSHIQAEQFGANSQPFYFFVDENGVKLADQGYGYDPDAEKFVRHLDAVKEKYKALHP